MDTPREPERQYFLLSFSVTASYTDVLPLQKFYICRSSLRIYGGKSSICDPNSFVFRYNKQFHLRPPCFFYSLFVRSNVQQNLLANSQHAGVGVESSCHIFDTDIVWEKWHPQVSDNREAPLKFMSLRGPHRKGVSHLQSVLACLIED